MRRGRDRRYGNAWARLAAWFTASAARRAPGRRWLILMSLFVAWLAAGTIGWAGEGVLEAIYRTFGALSMQDVYTSLTPEQMPLQIARFAGLAIPLVGLLFAFSGALGRSLAQAFSAWSADHIVITGAGAGPLALAQDCLARGDCVVLIARGIAEETSWHVARAGGWVIEGDAARIEILAGARAHRAAHVVAFDDNETLNLEIEALVRGLAQRKRVRRAIAVHVATQTPALLLEAREMRSHEQAKRDAAAKLAKVDPESALVIDAKPFSIDEIAARELIQKEAATILAQAAARGLERPHLVFFGFDEAGEALAVRAFMSLWSAHFAAPRVTVMTPDHERAARRFQARRPQAFAYPELWVADISFQPFDWRERPVDGALLDEIAQLRGPAAAIVVATGIDADNILLALALKRACNLAENWPVPIYMKEKTRSEFSQQYARGDETEALDAYLRAFGACENAATRTHIIEGVLDRGAAIAHAHYVEDMAARESVSMRELQAVARKWGEVRETYRDANRASADSAMVKMWDAGWRPAASEEREQAQTEPAVADDMMMRMAEREHDRWVAERLMNGWRPGAKRDNALRVHTDLVAWSALTEEKRARDATQVKAAMNVGRALNRRGFVKR